MLILSLSCGRYAAFQQMPEERAAPFSSFSLGSRLRSAPAEDLFLDSRLISLKKSNMLSTVCEVYETVSEVRLDL